jgi:Phosphatidylglycerophosphate synthase
MKKEKYSYKYFKEGMPEWKRIKDPFTSRIFYRPISFFCASIATKLNISANTVSYFSAILSIIACIFIAIPNHTINIIGAILVNVWLILDCTDGNIARSVKKQPFGGFADGISSYILVALLCSSLGIAAYQNNGVIFSANSTIAIIILGVLASTLDTLMRLIYQKYKSTERELIDQGKMKAEIEKRTDEKQTKSLLVHLEADFGVGGILPIFVLLAAIFKAYDIVVIYCFIYYVGAGILMSFKYILKTIKNTKIIENGEK